MFMTYQTEQQVTLLFFKQQNQTLCSKLSHLKPRHFAIWGFLNCGLHALKNSCKYAMDLRNGFT